MPPPGTLEYGHESDLVYSEDMKKAWRAWPGTTLGRLSLLLAAVSIVLWFLAPLLVQLREWSGFGPEIGLVFVVVLGVLSLSSTVLSWVSLRKEHNRSVVLLVAACAVTVLVALALVGETLEFVMMSSGG